MSIYIYRNNNDKIYYISSNKPTEEDNLIVYTDQEDVTIPTTKLEGIVLRESVIRKVIKEMTEHRRIMEGK